MAFHVGEEKIVVDSRDFDKKGDRENEKVSFVSLHVTPVLGREDRNPCVAPSGGHPNLSPSGGDPSLTTNVSQTALE